jgi:hypothetical protein
MTVATNQSHDGGCMILYLQIRFDISGLSTPLDQASVIVSRQGDARNIVGFASKNTDGSFEGTFSWDDWENQFGPIVQGEWDVSIAIGHSSPKTALLKKVATLTYAPGPASPALPGTVPVKARIADVTASLSQKPEIIHQFRPEETMVAAPVSFFFTAVIMLPTGAALGLMMHLGANVKGYYMQERANVANLFHAGVIAIIAIHLAFWIKFNLIQILPVLIPVEVATVLLGIKLSSSFTRTEARAKDKTA